MIKLDFGLKLPNTSRSSNKKRDRRRTFTKTQKNEIWAQQDGKCAKCHKRLDPRTVEYHHGRSWSAGGKTLVKNGKALCSKCHKIEHHKKRLQKIEKKPKSSKNKNIFGSANYPKIDFGLGSSKKKKRKKDEWSIL